MLLTGKLTQADLNEVRKMTVSKMYWPKLLLTNFYGIGVFAAITWATIAALLGRTQPNWPALALVWLVIAGILIWSVYNTTRKRAEALAKLNASLPDQVGLANDGLKLSGPNGATSFLPWRTFKGWREGKRIILVDQCDGNRIVILPVAEVSEIERQSVRQFLQSQIPSVSR